MKQLIKNITIQIYKVLTYLIPVNKKMIISTNLNLPELKQAYAERITSRLLGNYLLFKTYGDDIRIKKNLQKRKNTPYLT